MVNPSIKVCLDVAQRGQFHKPSSAVTQTVIKLNARFIKLTHEQIRHWRVTPVLEVPSAFELSRTPTNQQQRKIEVEMFIAVAQRRTIHKQRMVKERPIPIRSIRQIIKKVPEQGLMVGVDFRKLRQFLRVVPMVGQSMM